jgi:hypothetical protein
MNFKLLASGVLATALSLAGCVTSETKPIPKVEAKQAVVHIPEAELLDIGRSRVRSRYSREHQGR